MAWDKLFPAACILTVIFPLLMPSTALADVALCLIAVMFLAHCFRERQWGWLKESWVRILGLLWLYMIARGLFAESPKEALSRALPFGRYIVFAAALARWTLADVTTRHRFFTVLACFTVFSAFDGLLQYAAGRDVLFHKLIRDPNNGHIRLAGPYTKPILGIMLAWLAFPALLPALFHIDGTMLRGRRALIIIACLLVIFAAIALSGERMALLLTFFGMALAAFLLPVNKRLLLGGFGGLALLLAALAFAAPDMFHRQVGSTVDTLNHWQQSPYGLLLASDLTLAEKEPLVGLGANHFRIYCEALYPGDPKRITEMCNTHPHNIWLEWLIEEGIIGFLLFAGFVGAVFFACARAWPDLRGHPAFAGLIIAFILRVWPLMSTTGFFSRWGGPPFWLVLGALLVYTAGKGEKNAGATLPLQDAGL